MTAEGTLVADLKHFGLLQFWGADAQSFLQGQLSCDVAALTPGQASYGSYNTPKGRMLASFLLWRDDAGYTMQLPRSLCEPIRKRLAMYILRAKVTAIDASDKLVLIGIAGANARALLHSQFVEVPAAPLNLVTIGQATLLQLADARFQIVATRDCGHDIRHALSTAVAPAGDTAWDLANIRAGVPYITPETQEEFVPQMANLDLIGGVSFTKGCYPGQEIVARMHYLGRLKQRMYLANIAGDALARPGDKLYSPDARDQAAGTIVNAAPAPAGGTDVLAVVQIASFQGDDVHLASPTGPRLKFFALPYKIPV